MHMIYVIYYYYISFAEFVKYSLPLHSYLIRFFPYKYMNAMPGVVMMDTLYRLAAGYIAFATFIYGFAAVVGKMM